MSIGDVREQRFAPAIQQALAEQLSPEQVLQLQGILTKLGGNVNWLASSMLEVVNTTARLNRAVPIGPEQMENLKRGLTAGGFPYQAFDTAHRYASRFSFTTEQLIEVTRVFNNGARVMAILAPVTVDLDAQKVRAILADPTLLPPSRDRDMLEADLLARTAGADALERPRPKIRPDQFDRLLESVSYGHFAGRSDFINGYARRYTLSFDQAFQVAAKTADLFGDFPARAMSLMLGAIHDLSPSHAEIIRAKLGQSQSRDMLLDEIKKLT